MNDVFSHLPHRQEASAAIRWRASASFFGHAVGIRAGRVHYIHAVLAGVGRVNRVVAGAGPDHRLEVRGRIQNLRRHFFAAHDQRMQIGVLLGELQNVGFRDLHHLVAAVGFQNFLGYGIQRRRNQHFFHLSFPFVVSLWL